jgi:hypothetical protein
MQKPKGYDEAQASGEFTPVELGGHYCVVKQVAERQSSNGKDMIVVLIDFAKPDAQDGYFSKLYENDSRPQDEKKWPFVGTKYIMVNDFEDSSKTSRQFKTFCTCIEKSNNYEIKWGGNNWAQQFKGKKIGAVYGEEENEYDGKTFMRRVLKWFCNVDAVKDARVPEPKYLKTVQRANTAASNNTDFINLPETSEEEIPF